MSWVLSPKPMSILEALPVDKIDVCQALLDIDEKVRSNPLRWNGQFSPQFIEVLLAAYAKQGFHVLDPMMGGGTVLLEGARQGLRSTGVDVNPAAATLAKTCQLCNIPESARKQALTSIEAAAPFPLAASPLFAARELAPDYPSIRCFFATESGRHKQDSAERILRLAFSLVIDKPRLRDSPDGVVGLWEKFKNSVLALPWSEAAIAADIGDCRYLPIESNSIDLVITSPPYINVFNCHQQYRENTELLGWDVLAAARSEVGANRKHRQYRFLTVIQYCLDVSLCLAELTRVCKQGARAIFIVGRESRVRGCAIYNGRLVAELADHCGMTVILRQERSFKNKYGVQIFEDIIHLLPQGGAPQDILDKARITARRELGAAMKNANVGALADIQNAVAQAGIIMPSPTGGT